MTTLQARRVALTVHINGKNATNALAPDLKEFTFKDEAKGKADEVQLTLMDRDAKWHDAWCIQKGNTVTASLRCYDWYENGKNIALPMGSFTVDEIEYAGFPDVVKIKAVSAAKTTSMSEEKKTKGWETTTLKNIAQEIATKQQYTLMYTALDISLQRIDQREESDLTFLSRLATQFGVNLKVHDEKIIFFGAKEADAQKASLVITKKGSMHSPLSYSFKQSAQGKAKKAQATYHDPAKNETLQQTITPKEPEPSGQTLTLNQRAENAAQHMALTQGALRTANENETTASMEFMGMPSLVAGITVLVQGFGKFDGNYFVTSVEHKVAPAYTTSAELRRTLSY